MCPKCQHKAYLFGQDGARDVAKEMDLDLLGTNLLCCRMHKDLTAIILALSVGSCIRPILRRRLRVVVLPAWLTL